MSSDIGGQFRIEAVATVIAIGRPKEMAGEVKLEIDDTRIYVVRAGESFDDPPSED